MKIKEKKITVRDLVEGYQDKGDDGVVGYGGKLDIRPSFQRAFIYDERKQRAVIDTVINGFPLNLIYWSVADDGMYELLDGQQRTLSICRYVDGKFSHEFSYFENKPTDIQEKILSYELTIQICTGTPSEKLKWFETINIEGLKLTDQELRNATYAGPWVESAKHYLSRPGKGGAARAKDYVNGAADRQEVLERAIEWAALPHGWDVREYMDRHAKDPNANELWRYFSAVMDFAESTFPAVDKKLLKGQPWGALYLRYKDVVFDTARLQARIDDLMLDDDVTAKKGILNYVLAEQSGTLVAKDESGLSIRAFTPGQRLAKWKEQGGVCPVCAARGMSKTVYNLEEMEADHIKPWSKGGRTELSNCQMLCKFHNNEKKAAW
jgi:Restriction endonuclease